MGWFTRTPDPGKPPRWGFQTGWLDFVIALRTRARDYALTIDDVQLARGVVPLPEEATYEYWDLRAIAAVCRDAEPQQWDALLRAALLELYGRAGDVDLVDAPPMSTKSGAADLRLPTRERLRVQVFGAAALAGLDPSVVAGRALADAWAVIVEAFPGADAIVTRGQLAAAGISEEEAFSLGLANGVQVAAADAQVTTLALPGAACQLVVSSSAFLGAVMLTAHARLRAGTPMIMVPLTWRHWVQVTLGPTASRETIARLVQLVGTLAGNLAVPRAEWVGTTLWWWPPGEPPTPFAPSALPAALAARLGD